MKYSSVILIFIFFLVFDANLQAQLVDEMGIKAGVSISNFRIRNLTSLYSGLPPSVPNENIVNPLTVFFLRNTNFESMYFRAEIMYTRMGATITNSIPVVEGQSSEPTRYVDLTTEIGIHALLLSLSAEPTVTLGTTSIYGSIGATFNHYFGITNLVEFDDRFNRDLLGYQLGVGISFLNVIQQPLFLEISYVGNFKYFYRSGYGDFFIRSWFFTVGTSF